jgi:hypothetical protein
MGGVLVPFVPPLTVPGAGTVTPVPGTIVPSGLYFGGMYRPPFSASLTDPMHPAKATDAARMVSPVARIQ